MTPGAPCCATAALLEVVTLAGPSTEEFVVHLPADWRRHVLLARGAAADVVQREERWASGACSCVQPLGRDTDLVLSVLADGHF